MGSVINVTNVTVLNNPAPFTSKLAFEISFECLDNLTDDLEWKVVYVGSSEDEALDQTLDSVLVGPVPLGFNRFVFETDPPDHTKIPENEVVSVTVALLLCSYKGAEFIRVGYYVNNEYTDEELRLNPPPHPIVEKVQRCILADKPRVTRFPIAWDEVVDPQLALMAEADNPLLNDNVIPRQDMEMSNLSETQ